MITVLNGRVWDTEFEEPVPTSYWFVELLDNDELSDDLFVELLLNGVIARQQSGDYLADIFVRGNDCD